MKTTTFLKMTGVFGLLSALMLGLPASAQTRGYDIDAASEESFNLYVCSPRGANVRAFGDGDTDLDFWIYNPTGHLVHRDTDSTDWTLARLSGPATGCWTYELDVENLGDVYNRMRLTVRDR